VSDPSRRGHPLFAFGPVAGMVAAVTLTGCPQPAPTPTRPPPTAIEAGAPTQDVEVALDPVRLTGTYFVPEAVPPATMVLVRPRARTTLDRQRKAWAHTVKDARARLDTKRVEAEILATLLFEAATSDAQQRASLLTEARTAVDQVIAQAPADADAVILHMAASLALVLGDDAGAVDPLQQLVIRFPDRPDAAAMRAQLAFLQLRAGQDQAAAKTVAGLDAEASPELAYVKAWIAFRGGDRLGAAAAIARAASTWTADAYREPLVRDTLLMTARLGTPPEQARSVVASLVTLDDPVAARNLRHALLYMLSKAYAFAGRPDQAAAVVDLAVTEAGGAVPETDLPVYRLDQADYARRAGRIGDVAAAWATARAALEECKSCPDSSWSHFATGLSAWAIEMHTVYAKTGDQRYHDAARALYDLFAGLETQPEAETISRYAREFAQTRPPQTASGYGDGIKAPLASHLQEVQACYEQVLQGAPTLNGTVTLRLEVDKSGAVTGAVTEPPGGLTGLAAVGKCIEERARAWPLPSRTLEGVARITVPYQLAPAGATPGR